MPGNPQQGTIFRYLRQGRHGRYSVHLERLMSQMLDAERRRNFMTPYIPVPVQRLRATIQNYNIRNEDRWGNSSGYSVLTNEEPINANWGRNRNEPTGYQAQGQDNNSDNIEEPSYRTSANEEPADSSDEENDANYNEADSSFSSINSTRDMPDYVFAVAEEESPTGNDTTNNGNLVAVVEEIPASDEEDARNYAEVATFNDVNNTFAAVEQETATGTGASTSGNYGGTSIDFANADSMPSLTELLRMDEEEQTPHIFRSAPHEYDATRRGTRRPSPLDAPFLNTNPADIEMQAIQAIQRYEDFVQCGANGPEDGHNSVSLFLYTMRSVFPVFVLHPDLIIEFQTRALEYDVSKAIETLEELSPPKEVVPADLGESCMICLFEFEMNQRIRVLLCKHKYHTKCIDTWCKTSLTCPVCRGTVDGKGIDNIAHSYGDPLATLRGLEFVRAYLVRVRYNRPDDEDSAGPSTSQY